MPWHLISSAENVSCRMMKSWLLVDTALDAHTGEEMGNISMAEYEIFLNKHAFHYERYRRHSMGAGMPI